MTTSAHSLPKHWREPWEMGFSVFPVEHRGKQPLGRWKTYQTERPALDLVQQWAARPSNIGIATGAVSGLIVLDLDSDEAIADAERRGIPHTISVRTAKGRHYYFRHPGGVISNRAGVLPGCDIRGDGGYVVAAGSVHDSGDEYRWEDPPGLFDLADPPEWLLELLKKPEPEQRTNGHSFGPGAATAWAEAALRNEIAELMSASAGRRNHQLNIAAMKLGQLVAGGHLDEAEVKRRLQAAAAAIGLDEEEINPTIESGFVKGLSEPRNAPPDRDASTTRRAKSNAHGSGEDDADMLGHNGPLEASEDAIALAFTEQYGTTMRFDHDAGCWFRWDGTRWRQDRTDVALDFARRLARAIGESKRAMCKASVAAGAERFARADRAHAIESADWDRDNMLLGTPSGTVDLRTGAVKPADPADLITKQASVALEAGEPTLWLRFLEEALAGDQETIRFLQQWAGYCLTGDTREHALAFVYGPGGNGKTVFLNTLVAIVGDYAATAAMEAFTASRSDRHSTELAMLRGARLVTASETEEGRAWAEARIKQITGGDPITARFMRQDNFTFRPQFKLTIAGNHAPALRSVDDAMRRRFNIIPFITSPANPDRLLEQKLKEEHGRILSWAVAGCLDWQANGLVRPQAVTAATADYFENEDLFGQWLIERCDHGPSQWELPARLYSSWADYCKAAGDVPGTQRSLSGQLKRRGFMNAKSNGLRIYRGLSLKADGANHE